MSLGRGATVWRPWADGVHAVGELARLLGNLSANGRHAVAPLPMPRHNKGQYPLLGVPHALMLRSGHISVGNSVATQGRGKQK